MHPPYFQSSQYIITILSITTITTTSTLQGGRTRFQRYLSRMSSFGSSSKYSIDAAHSTHNHNHNVGISKKDSYVSGEMTSLEHPPTDMSVATGKGPLKDGYVDEHHHIDNHPQSNNNNNNKTTRTVPGARSATSARYCPHPSTPYPL